MARKSVERGISFDQARKRYYVLMDYGRDDGGCRVRQYRTFSTLRQARLARENFCAERKEGRTVFPQAMTVLEWLRYWMEQIVRPSRAETTRYSYQNVVENHVGPALGEVPVQQLTPQAVQRYYTMLLNGKGLSANTVRRHHDVLSSALRTAVRQGVLSHSPLDRVEPPRAVQREAAFYSPQQLRQLYRAAAESELDLTVHLAGSLGLRREEICGLRWSAVDFVGRRIYIRAARTVAGSVVVEKETKNKSSTRMLYLTDELIPLFSREWTRQDELGVLQSDGWVVTDGRGAAYPPNQLTLLFARMIARNGLPKLTLHGLRHTFATLASAQGSPLFEIGKALGHSTPATTGRIYTHLLDQTHQGVLDSVSAAVG